MDKRNLLCESELFSTLDPEEINELIALASEVEIKVGEILFTRGSEGDELFVLVRGRICLELDGRDGKTISLGALGEGDMFGEVSVLDGGKRSATVKATEPSELLAIRRNDLIALMQRFPNIAIKLLGVLAKKLRMTNELIEDTLGFNLVSKVAKELLGLARAYGKNTSNGIKINVDFSESELAGIVGTTVPKLEEQLTEWQRENVITMSRGYITILDVHKLKCLV
jgi:CRP/FNR family transcriptional regulator, cyclic AMP receptor protein